MAPWEIAVTAFVALLVFGMVFFYATTTGVIKADWNATKIKFCYDDECVSFEDPDLCVFEDCETADLIGECNDTAVKNAICVACEGCAWEACSVSENITACNNSAVIANICPNCVNITADDLNLTYEFYASNGTLVETGDVPFISDGEYKFNVTATNNTIKIYIGS